VILTVLLVAAVGISVFCFVSKESIGRAEPSLQDQLADTKGKQEKALADSQKLQQQVQKLQQENTDVTQKLSDKEKKKKRSKALSMS